MIRSPVAKVELTGLQNQRLRKRAMADKDFRENAPLDAAKEQQGIIEGRIQELESMLARTEILSAKPRKKQLKVAMGTKVTLKELGSGRKILYTLVDMREADVAAGKISTQSPVGQALLERSVGEEVEVTVPKGTVRYKVERIGT